MSDDRFLIKEGEQKAAWQTLLQDNKMLIIILLSGLIIAGLGVFVIKTGYLNESAKVEVIQDSTESQNNSKEVVVEISGAVENAGVYKLSSGSRIEDLLIAAGGVSKDADRIWMEKMLNRAAKLTDGQKIYIPPVTDKQISAQDDNVSGLYQTTTSVKGSEISGLVNINTSDSITLESLWGIGRVTAQKIIEQRPYSSVEELLTKKIIKTNVYEKIKEQISVY